MSHLVTIKTQIRDPNALQAACRRLGIAPPSAGEAMVYSTQAVGQILNLPGWIYPVVVDLEAGSIQYDNFGGAWGDQVHLDRLLQAYAVEKARLEALKAGHSVSEHALPDGSIKLTVQVAGGAA